MMYPCGLKLGGGIKPADKHLLRKSHHVWGIWQVPKLMCPVQGERKRGVHSLH